MNLWIVWLYVLVHIHIVSSDDLVPRDILLNIPNSIIPNASISLLEASAKGLYETVKSLLAINKNDVNKIDLDGYSSLMLSCKHGHYFTVTELLKAEADVNVESNSGANSLLLAVSGNFKEITNILLEAGADPNSTNKQSGKTIVMLASQLNFINILDMLIKRKSNLDTQAPQGGESALLYASVAGNSAIVSALLAGGANIELCNNRGYSALMLASSRGHVGVMGVLLQYKADINKKDNFRMTAMDHAINKQKSQVIELLASAGADIGSRGIHMNEDVRQKREVSLWKMAHPYQLHPSEEDSSEEYSSDKSYEQLEDFTNEF